MNNRITQVEILSNGLPTGTYVIDRETGKKLTPVQSITWSISVNNFAQATIHQIGPALHAKDVIASIIDPTDVSDLRLKALRGANVARLPTFKDAQGRTAHSHPLGFDWDLSKWMNAIHGECGEAANIIKKIERGDFSLEPVREVLADELADIVCYLDLLAIRAGIDLGEAIINKFNEVSARVGSNVRLAADTWFTNPSPRPEVEEKDQY